jgi:hypothetical protein
LGVEELLPGDSHRINFTAPHQFNRPDLPICVKTTRKSGLEPDHKVKSPAFLVWLADFALPHHRRL